MEATPGVARGSLRILEAIVEATPGVARGSLHILEAIMEATTGVARGSLRILEAIIEATPGVARGSLRVRSVINHSYRSQKPFKTNPKSLQKRTSTCPNSFLRDSLFQKNLRPP